MTAAQALDRGYVTSSKTRDGASREAPAPPLEPDVKMFELTSTLHSQTAPGSVRGVSCNIAELGINLFFSLKKTVYTTDASPARPALRPMSPARSIDSGQSSKKGCGRSPSSDALRKKGTLAKVTEHRHGNRQPGPIQVRP